MRRIYGTIAIMAVAAAVIALFFAVDPSHIAWMPKCFFKLLTGYDCPGCGSMRAFHHVLHGRIGQAAAMNPMLVLAVPYALTLLWLTRLGGASRFPRLYDVLTGRMAIRIVLILIVGYWIGRNIG